MSKTTVEIGREGEKIAVKILNFLKYKNIKWISDKKPLHPYDISAEKNGTKFIFDVKVRGVGYPDLYNMSQLYNQLQISLMEEKKLGFIFIYPKKNRVSILSLSKTIFRGNSTFYKPYKENSSKNIGGKDIRIIMSEAMENALSTSEGSVLTRSQRLVLDTIPVGEYVTSGDIARETGKVLSNVSNIMKILYVNGYISRIGGFVGLYKKKRRQKNETKKPK